MLINNIQVPQNCPICQAFTEMDGKYLICPNNLCPARVLGNIKVWISTLNILEWGDTLVERLVSSGKVQNVADLYRLSVEDLASMERMGDTSAQKCYDILHAGKEITVEQLLGSLNIPMIGISMIKMVTSAGYDTFEKIQKLTKSQLENISGLGPNKADSLYEGIRKNKSLINDLFSVGVSIKEKTIGKLTGYKIAITGSTTTKRAVLEKFISDNGGENKSSVGKGCTHLIIADVNSTSSKAVSARKLGIKLVSEQDILALNV